MARFKYDQDINSVKKGDIISCVEYTPLRDGIKEWNLKLRVDRVNKNSVSVTCIDGYMMPSGWKIRKNQEV